MAKSTKKNPTFQLASTDNAVLTGHANADGTIDIAWQINIAAGESLFWDFMYKKVNGGTQYTMTAGQTNYETQYHPPLSGELISDDNWGTPFKSGDVVEYQLAVTVGDVSGNASFFSEILTITIP